jgi:ATP-dependent exoDNAse (exonuclease V) beta subunit
VHGASPAEVAGAERVVRRALDQPLVREAARAAREGRCYREAAVTYRCDDGSIVEGTVDLAYDSGAGFVVIDFKTDKPDTQLLERYRRQVALYAAAIEHATGRAARPVLMTI